MSFIEDIPNNLSEVSNDNDQYLSKKLREKGKFYLPFQSIHVVKINRDQWELSTCNCSNWFKNYKCNHKIAVSSLLKLCNFKEIAMNLPLERKRRPGRPKITANALSRQPNETQKISDLGISSCEGSDLDSSINDEAPPQKKPRHETNKRGRPVGSKKNSQ